MLKLWSCVMNSNDKLKTEVGKIQHWVVQDKKNGYAKILKVAERLSKKFGFMTFILKN